MFNLFQRNKYLCDDYTRAHYQFFIINDITLLHLMCEDDNPCPYTGIKVLTTILQPDCFFGMELQFKGYSWSFYLISFYWKDQNYECSQVKKLWLFVTKLIKKRSMKDLKRYKITITVTTRDGAFDTKIGDSIWNLLDVENGEKLDSVSLPVELPPNK